MATGLFAQSSVDISAGFVPKTPRSSGESNPACRCDFHPSMRRVRPENLQTPFLDSKTVSATGLGSLPLDSFVCAMDVRSHSSRSVGQDRTWSDGDS